MLSRAVSTGWHDRGQGRFFVQEETLNGAAEVYERFGSQLHLLKQAIAARKEARLARDAALNRLIPYIQDWCVSLRKRVKRNLLPSNILSYYGVPMSGRTPHPTARAEWVEWGLQLQRGDDNARNAGHAGIPYRSELDDAILAAQDALHMLDHADEALTPLREGVVRTRADIDALAREIRMQLRFAVRSKPKAQQHVVLNAYGLSRRYGQDPSDDAGDELMTETVDSDAVEHDAVEHNAVEHDAADSFADEPDADSEAAGVPPHYSVPFSLRDEGSGVSHPNGNGLERAA